MVTRAQIDKLGSRIEALATALGHERPTFACYLRFYDESEDEFHARYPELPRPWVPDVVLSFGDDPMHGRSDGH